MNLLSYYAVVEDALNQLDIKSENARCEGEGEWMILKDGREIYLDVWVPGQKSQWQYYSAENPEPVFQMICPIARVSKDTDKQRLFEDLMQLNFHLYYGSFMLNGPENIIALQYRRLATGLNQRELLEPLNAIGYYAVNLGTVLIEKFQLEKL
jgi:hypothetical protein